jgi:peptidoglycan/LPS O-acetylase OafA/YrhL
MEVRSSTAFAVFGFSLLAILCAAIVGACARWSGRPFLRLGTISYMAYLIHISTYTATGLLLMRLGATGSLPFLRGLISLPVAIGLAAISWRYFESPILALKDLRFRSPALSAIEVESLPAAALVATEPEVS